MKTETSVGARQYRLMEWADQIRDCQSRSKAILRTFFERLLNDEVGRDMANPI